MCKTHENQSRLDLKSIIVIGDALNHAIVRKDEVLSCLAKLQTTGILKVRYLKIQYTELGMDIIEKAERTRGGWFARVKITEKKLNSNRNKFPGGKINLTVMNNIKSNFEIAVNSYCKTDLPKPGMIIND